jgi:SAM-dependent methyltransferase
MDYDLTEIPAGYDRGRDHGPEFLGLWMAALERYLHGLDVRRILDLGCGTGRFSEALATHFRAEVVGIDPSVKMLERAREKQHPDRVQYQFGSAEAISLPPRSADVIFISMSFHHFVDRASAARECRRVLRDQGVVCVRTGTREQIQSYPYVPFFPSTPPKLVEVLPDHAELREPFEAAPILPICFRSNHSDNRAKLERVRGQTFGWWRLGPCNAECAGVRKRARGRTSSCCRGGESNGRRAY